MVLAMGGEKVPDDEMVGGEEKRGLAEDVN